MTTQTFALSGPISVVGRTGHGSFAVTASDDCGEASVTLTARTRRSEILARTVVELRGSTLWITSPRQGGIFDLFGRSRDAIDVAVCVPSGTPVTIATVTAGITLTGRCGAADLACGASDIVVDRVDGDLRLRYGSGSCRVGAVSGSVQLRAGSGNADFAEIGGQLNAVCGSGRLQVAMVRGVVRARAGSGNVSLEAVYGDVDVVNGSGDVGLGLPGGVPARVDVVSGTGQVYSQLPISDRARSSGRPITVRARAGSGAVRLFRAAAAAAGPISAD